MISAHEWSLIVPHPGTKSLSWTRDGCRGCVPFQLVIPAGQAKLLREPGMLQIPKLREVPRQAFPHLGYHMMVFYRLPLTLGAGTGRGMSSLPKASFHSDTRVNFAIDWAIKSHSWYGYFLIVSSLFTKCRQGKFRYNCRIISASKIYKHVRPVCPWNTTQNDTRVREA